MRKLHRIVVTAAVAIGALVAGFAVLGTPGSDGVARAGGDSLQVVAGEFFFSPGTLTADADTDFTVTLTNNGGILHNFTIDVGGFPATGNAPGGGTTSETFNLAAGSYDYFCSIGGHRGAGNGRHHHDHGRTITITTTADTPAADAAAARADRRNNEHGGHIGPNIDLTRRRQARANR